MDFTQYFAYDYHGKPFTMFEPGHLAFIAFFALLILTFVLLRKRITPSGDKAIRYTLAAVLFCTESSWHLWNVYWGKWTIQEHLPLHACSLMIWAAVYMLVRKNYRIFEFVYLLGIPTAIQAFLTPDAGIYGFPHFRLIQTLITHGTLITTGIYMAVVVGLRPTWASVKRVFIVANVALVIIFGLNFLLGSNYMFLAHKLSTPSLLDVLPPWPYYIIVIELLGVFFVLALYSPYAIRDWATNRKAKKAQACR